MYHVALHQHKHTALQQLTEGRERVRARSTAMARRMSVGLAAAVVLVVVVASTMESGSMAAAQGLCKMSQDGLTACKPSISSVKPVDKPTDACCSALKGADLPCLCSYKNSNLLPYLGIDPSLAMQLPAKCNIPAPAQC